MIKEPVDIQKRTMEFIMVSFLIICGMAMVHLFGATDKLFKDNGEWGLKMGMVNGSLLKEIFIKEIGV